MDSSFWYKLLASFVVGSAWVTLGTVTAERYGSKVGGVIGGFPSAAFVALLFIGFTQTPRVASSATTVMPLAQGFNGLFLIAYMTLARHGLRVALAGSLFVWLLLASTLAAMGTPRFWVSITGWVFLILFCYLLVERRMNIPSQGKRSMRYTLPLLAFRVLLGGTTIAFAVLMGKVAGPLFGGIFATFPAMFISTLVVTYRTGGAPFSRAVAKALMVSGLVNVGLYAIMVRYLYPLAGLWYGTVLALVLSCGTGYLTYLFMRENLV